MTRVRQDAVRQIVLTDNALHTGLSAYAASQCLAAAAQTAFDAALAAYRRATVRQRPAAGETRVTVPSFGPPVYGAVSLGA
jgi:hypothetical protein